MKKLTMALGLAVSLTAGQTAWAEDDLTMKVYKSPSCGCCGDWVDHMEENGFEVDVTDTNNMNQVKMDAGLNPQLASCHTAFVGDYVIEGHVPAADVRRLMEEQPNAHGLSAPGMPMGSPGMDIGDRKDHYQVLLFNEAGQTRVFAEHN
ncbi:DUF411 domain-containing protein [Marinobacter zhanjiangensis]|uniref:CopG family transcriptional regulator n=1 Tax=Marinobacter zhanjiangensis TaxID=578215 RepID=A0ABQ3B9I6_9GAMM|nr:DUF411 domain-containing protein [Marinobacter zhanjiangensis]GGY85802.1 CopG family transcriptional regulator [Marinobacter zhanjiangensis]